MEIVQLYLFYLTLLLPLFLVRGTLDCLNLQLSISQKVENEGFHRNINWLIESLNIPNENWKTSNCEISLQLDMPSEMFVNPDELLELNRTGQILAYVEGDVNIETPAHESEEHKVYIFLKSDNIKKVSIELPVHLRYQRAVIAGGFGKINVAKPSLLVLCPIAGKKLCDEYPVVTAPCDSTGQHFCIWQNVTYQALFEDVQLFVPIGDLDDYPIVSVVTLLLGCFGSIYILSLLSSMPL